MTYDWIICPQCKGKKKIKLRRDKEERTCDWCNGEGSLYVRIPKHVKIDTKKRQ